jgi:hypothetical protein
MDSDSLQVVMRLDAGPDADAEELEELTQRLRRMLLESDVESVERMSGGEAPGGTRGGPVLLVGSLLVTLAKSPELLKLVTRFAQSVVAGSPARSVELQVDGDRLVLNNASPTEQQQLIALFVQRHTAVNPAPPT